MRHHAALLETDDIGHGFFGRAGGVSTGIFSSLNCGPGSNDDPEAIAENQKRVLTKLHAEHNPLVTLHQIHSADVITVTAPLKYDHNDRPRADAMVTRNRNIALGILTADCCPILLADHDTGVIGAIHAGWRGAMAGVIPNTIKAMRDIGSKVQHIRAAIGPTIGQTSYEVGAEVYNAFTTVNSSHTKFFQAAAKLDHFMFNLPGFVAENLMASGVQLFENLGIDTYPAANDFFSYRRRTHENDASYTSLGGGNYGRQISVITLR